MEKKTFKYTTGFTVLELIVSIGIFAFMTALLLARYGNFNQGVLLNNLAYDIALTIRNAQSYGLNVKSATRSSNDFQYPYGVHFDSRSGSNNRFLFFTDIDNNGIYTVSADKVIATTTITRGSRISNLYINNDKTVNLNSLSVTYKRPDPNSIIKTNGNSSLSYPNAQIRVMAADGTYRDINVSSVGQISVIPVI
jgi:type II secretory pathway pseudopilin PulG